MSYKTGSTKEEKSEVNKPKKTILTKEERELIEVQEKIDKFPVIVHSSVKLKIFKETGRGLCVTQKITKGKQLIEIPVMRSTCVLPVWSELSATSSMVISLSVNEIVTPKYIIDNCKIITSYLKNIRIEYPGWVLILTGTGSQSEKKRYLIDPLGDLENIS